MVQLANVSELKKEDIPKLVEIIKPELEKKQKLYARYRRKDKDTDIIHGRKNLNISFEKYCIDNASGYLGGKEPTYEVQQVTDEKKKGLLRKVLNKVFPSEDYAESMKMIIDHIVDYNDDGTENYTLVKDLLTTGTCYEILYENSENEIVYTRKDPLQTQAIWDYSVPRNLIGIVNIYEEKDVNGTTSTIVELTDKTGTRKFKGSGSNYEESKVNEDEKNHNWGDVPYTVAEIPDGIGFVEPVLDIINAYEELIQSLKETFKYNNNAKLKVTGYRPQDELLVPLLDKDGVPVLDASGNKIMIENKVRKDFDEALLKAPVFYTPDDGDIDWILKTIDDGSTQNTLKTYIDLIMMITGVPQTTDLGFTKADNASAIDRKFFTLEQVTTQAMQLLKMAYKRRWELIFNRYSLKGQKFDFRDVKITLNKNLPANENEMIDMYLKLRGLVSDETIIERIPLDLDANSEMNKMEEQEQDDLDKEVQKASAMSQFNNKQVKEEKK